MCWATKAPFRGWRGVSFPSGLGEVCSFVVWGNSLDARVRTDGRFIDFTMIFWWIMSMLVKFCMQWWANGVYFCQELVVSWDTIWPDSPPSSGHRPQEKLRIITSDEPAAPRGQYVVEVWERSLSEIYSLENVLRLYLGKRCSKVQEAAGFQRSTAWCLSVSQVGRQALLHKKRLKAPKMRLLVYSLPKQLIPWNQETSTQWVRLNIEHLQRYGGKSSHDAPPNPESPSQWLSTAGGEELDLNDSDLPQNPVKLAKDVKTKRVSQVCSWPAERSDVLKMIIHMKKQNSMTH